MGIGNKLIVFLRKLFLGDQYYINCSETFRHNYEFSEGEIVVVGTSKYPKWAHMKCPCGCNDTITLSLMQSHKPNWSLKYSIFGEVSFHPSIWKTDGCKSHFWIKKNKLFHSKR